jgi:hypothetical protein
MCSYKREQDGMIGGRKPLQGQNGRTEFWPLMFTVAGSAIGRLQTAVQARPCYALFTNRHMAVLAAIGFNPLKRCVTLTAIFTKSSMGSIAIQVLSNRAHGR